MKHTFLESAKDKLQRKYNLDVFQDVLLNRHDKIICFADTSNNEIVLLEIISGSFSLLGFSDTATLSLETLLRHMDLDNAYAEVGGKQEYYASIADVITDVTTPSNLTFPLIVNGKRNWIRVTTVCVDKQQKIQAFHITIVTDFISYDEEIYYKSHHDSLTDIFNKYTLDYHYGLRYRKNNFTVMYLDLDNFKELNDILGHREGDNYLVEFAQILKAHEHDYTRFYRIGGDEFVGFFFEPEAHVKGVAQAIVDQTSNLTAHLDHVTTSVSIGIIQATIRDDVIRKADRLMYKAKELGKNRYVYEIEQ